MKFTKDSLLDMWFDNSYRKVWPDSYSMCIYEQYIYLKFNDGKTLFFNWLTDEVKAN